MSITFGKSKGLFGDNSIGTDLVERVEVESFFQFGGLRLYAGDFVPNPGQAIGQSFICLNQFIGSDLTSDNVIPNPEDGTIQIFRTGVYLVKLSLSFESNMNAKWDGSLFRNDVNMEVCSFVELMRPNGEVSTVSTLDPIVISKGDSLEYRVRSDQGSADFILMSGQFFCFRIG